MKREDEKLNKLVDSLSRLPNDLANNGFEGFSSLEGFVKWKNSKNLQTS